MKMINYYKNKINTYLIQTISTLDLELSFFTGETVLESLTYSLLRDFLLVLLYITYTLLLF